MIVVASGVRTAERAVALTRSAMALALLWRAPRLAEPALTGLTRLLRRPAARCVHTHPARARLCQHGALACKPRRARPSLVQQLRRMDRASGALRACTIVAAPRWYVKSTPTVTYQMESFANGLCTGVLTLASSSLIRLYRLTLSLGFTQTRRFTRQPCP